MWTYDICRRFTKLYNTIMDDQDVAEAMKKCNTKKGAFSQQSVMIGVDFVVIVCSGW